MAARNTAFRQGARSFVESHLPSIPVKWARQRWQNFLNEKAEHVPRGTAERPTQQGRPSGTEERTHKDPLSPNMGKLLFCHFPHIFVIKLTRILRLGDNYGLLLITFTAQTSSVAGDKESKNRLHE